jgi:hypothetical protein
MAKSSNREYILYLILSIIVFLSFPFLQFVIPQINPNHHNYNFILNNYSAFEFWQQKILIFNIIGILSIVFSFIAFRLVSAYRIEDYEKKSKLVNKNILLLSVTFVGNLFINSVCIGLNELIFFNGPKYWHESEELRLLYFVVISLMYSTSIFILMLVFVGTRNLIKFDLKKMDGKKDEIDKYSSIYWLYFIKYIFISTPSFLVGTMLLTLLSAISFVVMGGTSDFFRQLYISSVAFYSFYITSVLLIVGPILTGMRKLNSVYNEYTLHIIRNSILPNLRNHVVLMGVGNLGSQIIRNGFENIHPEGYQAKSLYQNQDKQDLQSSDKLSDYNITIDKDLKLQLISQRIVVFDKDPAKFKDLFNAHSDLTIGIFNPWLDQEICISILGVCEKELSSQVLNILAVEKSVVILNATPNSTISLYMASKCRIKQILSVNDSYSFDTLTSTTYDKAVFLIDTQGIEGIMLSQLVFQLVNTNIRHNLQEHKWKVDLNDLIKKASNNTEFNHNILWLGNGRVLIIGSGDYIYHFIKSLILTLSLSMDLNDRQIRNLIEDKVYLLTNDEYIKLELEKRDSGELEKDMNGAFHWKFYPIRNNKTKLEDFYRITTFIGSIENFEKIIDVLSSISKYPEIIVLINPHAYTAVDMFVSVSTAIEVINKTLEINNREKYKYIPHVLIYSTRNDEYYLTRHFKKYLTYNRKRYEKIGFPTQLAKESLIIKDWHSALRFTAILKALIVDNSHSEKDGKFSHHVAEITFSAREQNGSLANLAANLTGKEIVYDQYKGSKVPRFLNYYSTEGTHFKDTFLFKGLAQLENRVEIKDINEIVNYCFINCEMQSRELIYGLVESRFGFNRPKGSAVNLVDKLEKRDLGMFSNYPGSSILRHPDKYYDILFRRPAFYLSPEPPEALENNEENVSLKNCFNVGDFTIWSEGEETPGSLAEVLTEVILCKTREKAVLDNQKWDIQIFHTANRPSPFFKEVEAMDKPEPVYTQDSFYIRLKPKKHYKSEALMRAAKIKLSGEILLENLDWSRYLFSLKEHLISKTSFIYYLYVIEKIFVEGLEVEGREGITAVNYYYKINNEDDLRKIGDGYNPEFKVIRSWQKVKQINKWKEIPTVLFLDNRKDYYKTHRTQVQRYEFVVIREDIVNQSREESIKDMQFGEAQNKLYYIDDI